MARQAGESVRRSVIRTLSTSSPNCCFSRSRSAACSRADAPAFFVLLATDVLQVELTATDVAKLQVLEFAEVAATHSSIGSASSSTSMPFLRKISRCGLLRAAARLSAVTNQTCFWPSDLPAT